MQAYTEITIACFALVVAVMVLVFIRQSRKAEDKLARRDVNDDSKEESLNTLYQDEIIAVRKRTQVPNEESAHKEPKPTLIFHVMADEGKHLAGYELLQAILSQGFKFGAMNIFHRYQLMTGKGPVMFSLASAEEPGTFDIKNMRNHQCCGLTLFMQSSGNDHVDNQRLDLMHKAALNLAKDLNAKLLDGRRAPLTHETLHDYKKTIAEVACSQAVA